MGDYTDSPTKLADSTPTASASAVSSVPVSNPQADPNLPDPNRPISTIPADSQVQPVSKPELQPDQVLEGSASASIIPPADSTPTATDSADLQPSVPISTQSPESPQVPGAPVATVLPTPEPQLSPSPTPPEAPKESVIQDHSSPNQPSKVQPEAPQNTPVIRVESTTPQSAGIKPEPPQGTQNAPSADVKLPETPKSSFGDLMGTPADLSEEPAIHIDPIEAPTTIPETPAPSAQSSDPISSVSSDQQKEESTQRRQRANEVRTQKKNENLEKIITFVQNKGKATNLDIRDFLHISQTTATDYLHTLVNSGKLRKEGKAKATIYSL